MNDDMYRIVASVVVTDEDNKYVTSITWYRGLGPDDYPMHEGAMYPAYKTMPGFNQRGRVPLMDAEGPRHLGSLVAEVLTPGLLNFECILSLPTEI